MYASPELIRMQNIRKRQRYNEMTYRSKKRKPQLPRISLSIQQKEPIKNAIDILKKSQNENKSHSANICVICDRFIKGI